MADIVTSRIFQDGEKNITAVKMNDIIGSSVIQPAFVSAKPSTSTIATTDNLLVLQTAGTYAKAPFQTVIDSVSAGINSDTEIWSVRLRSFNAAGNPTFEVNQRLPGGTVTTGFPQDRWGIGRAGTMAVSVGQNAVAGGINWPGTNFSITQNFCRVTLTTAQSTLGASDYIQIYQFVEGPFWRELQNDVHSFQVLVRSSVANLVVGAGLQDPTAAHSLVNTLTLGAANTWTALTLPNLPVWPSGTFTNAAGNVGYLISFALAAGTTRISPASGTWQNGAFIGAVGQSNFAGSAVNSTFDIAYISHEPGASCSNPPMDCSFTDNLAACQRYYQNSYSYGTRPGSSANVAGAAFFYVPANSHPVPNIFFKKTMAKVPSVTSYSTQTGSAGVIYDSTNSVDRGISSGYNVGTNGFSGFLVSSPIATVWSAPFHWMADTGW